jgi:NADPH:quinone reductase-like Zn-dependent oxidoreductase
MNHAEILQRQGFYGQQPDFGDPVNPGLEIACEVVDVGTAATGFRNGDRVVAIVGGEHMRSMPRVDSRMAMAIWIKPVPVFQVGRCGSPCPHISAEYAEVRGVQFRSSSSRLTEMPG